MMRFKNAYRAVDYMLRNTPRGSSSALQTSSGAVVFRKDDAGVTTVETIPMLENFEAAAIVYVDEWAKWPEEIKKCLSGS